MNLLLFIYIILFFPENKSSSCPFLIRVNIRFGIWYYYFGAAFGGVGAVGAKLALSAVQFLVLLSSGAPNQHQKRENFSPTLFLGDNSSRLGFPIGAVPRLGAHHVRKENRERCLWHDLQGLFCALEWPKLQNCAQDDSCGRRKWSRKRPRPTGAAEGTQSFEFFDSKFCPMIFSISNYFLQILVNDFFFWLCYVIILQR